MASVAIVLAVVFTGICMAEYQRSASAVEEALASAIEHASEDPFGHRDKPQDKFDMLGMTGSSNAGGQAQNDGEGMGASGQSASGHDQYGLGNAAGSGGGSGNGNGNTANASGAKGASANSKSDGSDENTQYGPRIGGMKDGRRESMVPVAVYAVSETSSMRMVSGYATASIDGDVLTAAYERLTTVSDGSGTFGDLGLHYKKKTEQSTTYLAFADTSTTDNWQSLAVTLAIAGLGTLVVFFVISLFLSRWALRPVKEAWDSQRQFVADASHDLKTPLTVILANSSILLKHPERTIASESQWIESTQVEAKQMQGLVNEMLELAQVEAGAQVNTPHEQVDFSDLVDGETLMFDSMALERNCRFDCDIEQGIAVMGNDQQLHKMVSTLVENAFKYVNDGGSITVVLSREAKKAKLAVTNTGSVISPDDLPHIFDRFYRTDKARTSGAGGFGLGLAIAREIARAHNGDITCESSESLGTTFTVSLPIC